MGETAAAEVSRVRVLPEVVANRIAAGEVIERPASVVKELVENSLDAGASEVTVEVRAGGRQLLRVSDDGGGMSPAETRLALERHGTSKLRTATDLLTVGTFGFRGEALPSIASVSRFGVRTRRRGFAEGYEIYVEAGRIEREGACAAAPGTVVEVAHLFHGVPARRKFLRTENTETAHIVAALQLFALAHPAVAFRLEVDGREVFRSPVCPGLRERVGEIFGPELAEGLWPLAGAEEGFRLEGLVGPPGLTRSSRGELAVFVNRRPVFSPLLRAALTEAYTGRLPRGKPPVAFLFLSVPSEAVDVNVHPAKREVRFRNEWAVRRFFLETLLGVLEGSGPARAVASNEALPARGLAAVPAPEEARAAEGKAQEEPTAGPDGKALSTGEVREAPVPFVAEPRRVAQPAPAPPEPWRFVGAFRPWGLLFEREAGLVLVHAAAARQRILFERMQEELAAETTAQQPLLLPETHDWGRAAAAALAEHESFFAGLGFALEPFGGTCWRIRGAPAWLREESPGAFLEELLEALAAGEWTPRQAEAARMFLAQRAAGAVARAGSFARETPPDVLLELLLSCREPLTDPWGRPTMKAWDNAELGRIFAR